MSLVFTKKLVLIAALVFIALTLVVGVASTVIEVPYATALDLGIGWPANQLPPDGYQLQKLCPAVQDQQFGFPFLSKRIGCDGVEINPIGAIGNGIIPALALLVPFLLIKRRSFRANSSK